MSELPEEDHIKDLEKTDTYKTIMKHFGHEKDFGGIGSGLDGWQLYTMKKKNVKVWQKFVKELDLNVKVVYEKLTLDW